MHSATLALTQDPGRAGAHLVNAALLAHWACMLVVGLDLPGLSTVAITCAGIFALQHLARERVVGPAFVVGAVLLFAALATYYLLASSHGLVAQPRGIALTAALLAAFVAGYSAARRDAGSSVRIVGLVVAVLALNFYAVATTAGGGGVSPDVFARDELRVRSLWSGTYVTSTLIGSHTALGVCLLPAALLWTRRGGAALAVRGTFAAAAALAVYANLVLQNRTPFIAGGVALFACAAVAHVPGTPRWSGWARVLALATLVGGLVAAVGMERFTTMGAAQRFAAQSFETARYDSWREVVTHLFDHPTGGRLTPLSETAAHNLWLDIAWDSGPLPFALMASFHLLVAGVLLRRIGRQPLLTQLVLVGMGVAFAATAMAEPAMNLTSYTTLLFYFCGLAVGLEPLRPASRETRL